MLTAVGDSPRLDDKGQRRRRAEYIVLRTIQTTAEPTSNSVKQKSLKIARDLNGDMQPLVATASSGSSGQMSQDYNCAIQHLIRMGRIEMVGSGLQLTEKGEEFLDDHNTLDKFGIDEEFRSQVAEVMASK